MGSLETDREKGNRHPGCVLQDGKWDAVVYPRKDVAHSLALSNLQPLHAKRFVEAASSARCFQDHRRKLLQCRNRRLIFPEKTDTMDLLLVVQALAFTLSARE
jgi:hypothetical protein